MPHIDLAAAITEWEGERVEVKTSLDNDEDLDDIREAACSFANDFPGSQQPGIAVIGVGEDRRPSRAGVTQATFQKLESVRTMAAYTTPLSGSVYWDNFEGSKVAVLVVEPSRFPPVFYKGRAPIRFGSSKSYATPEQLARLEERVPVLHRIWDLRPCTGFTIQSLNVAAFRDEFLPVMLHGDLSLAEGRTDTDLLGAARIVDRASDIPTNCGILMLGIDPTSAFPWAEVRYSRYHGPARDSAPIASRTFSGSLPQQVTELEGFFKGSTGPTGVESPESELARDYPPDAMRELLVNAIMHRAYDGTHAPIQVYHHSNRIEIHSPGGLYGQVNRATFGRSTDYRNPTIAACLNFLGSVERFGTGIPRVRAALRANGNPPPQFQLGSPEAFQVTVMRRG